MASLCSPSKGGHFISMTHRFPWRRRVGVEPTRDAVKGPALDLKSGFQQFRNPLISGPVSLRFLKMLVLGISVLLHSAPTIQFFSSLVCHNSVTVRQGALWVRGEIREALRDELSRPCD